MKPHRTRIREHLRSARVSALTLEERRAEMRAAEAHVEAGHRDQDPEPGSGAGPCSARKHAVPKPGTEVPAP
jgi:hypothetical protein